MGVFKKPLSNILSRFERIVDDLEGHHASCVEEIKANDETVAILNDETKRLHADKDKAIAVAAKIKDLIAA